MLSLISLGVLEKEEAERTLFPHPVNSEPQKRIKTRHSKKAKEEKRLKLIRKTWNFTTSPPELQLLLYYYKYITELKVFKVKKV